MRNRAISRSGHVRNRVTSRVNVEELPDSVEKLTQARIDQIQKHFAALGVGPEDALCFAQIVLDAAKSEDEDAATLLSELAKQHIERQRDGEQADKTASRRKLAAAKAADTRRHRNLS